MLLSQLVIVFLGVAGNRHAAVEHQLEPMLAKAGVTELAVTESDRSAIVHHTKPSRDLVKKLHVDGVVAGELVASGGRWSFHVVIYDGDGKLSDDSETPLTGSVLAKVDLDVLGTNLRSAIDTISKRRHPVGGAPRLSAASTANDDDAPPGLGGARPAPAKRTAAKPEQVAAAEPEQTVEVTPETPAARSSGGGITVHAGLTLGIVGRVLSTDPNTVKDYSATPVGTAGFEAGIEPMRRLAVSGGYERTIVMSSIVAGAGTPTAISRWQFTGAYDVVHGAIDLAPVIGIGHRAFSIDSASTTRTPDSDYTYLIAGASITKPIGTRLALRALAAFEPVVGGAEPMMLGSASRWGFDVGASLSLRATAHVFAAATIDYQQFSWSWSGTGGATDGYPSGTLAAGAMF